MAQKKQKKLDKFFAKLSQIFMRLLTRLGRALVLPSMLGSALVCRRWGVPRLTDYSVFVRRRYYHYYHYYYYY